MPRKPQNIVVFDLDETLGHFGQLGLVWDALCDAYASSGKPPPSFDRVMSLFKEYQRPGVMKMLRYIAGKKEQQSCGSVMVYTNNQGPKEWAQSICRHFEGGLGQPLFDRVIGAFKVRGTRVEPLRTSHDKSVDDLLSCTKLPSDTQICFIDDVHHPRMECDNVYYIHIKPYVYSMRFSAAAERLLASDLVEGLSVDEKSRLSEVICGYASIYPRRDIDTPEDEIAADAVVGKRILQHLQNFFKQHGSRYSRRNPTRRLRRGTRKR